MLTGWLSVASTPRFIEILNYLSPVRYASRILGTNEFTGLVFSCDTENCLFKTGEDVLGLYGFENEYLTNFIVLICLAVIYRLLSLVVLSLVKN
jgi:hypothetical protein